MKAVDLIEFMEVFCGSKLEVSTAGSRHCVDKMSTQWRCGWSGFVGWRLGFGWRVGNAWTRPAGVASLNATKLPLWLLGTAGLGLSSKMVWLPRCTGQTTFRDCIDGLRRPLSNFFGSPHNRHRVGHLASQPRALQTMTMLKQKSLQSLASVDGLTAEPTLVSGGTALFFRGREFAHFHNDHELDLRLTKKVIRSLGLSHPTGSVHHPTRSTSSPWIEVRFNTDSEVERAIELVKVALEQL